MKWQSGVVCLGLHEDVLRVADLVLQIVLKRMMHNIIHELTAQQASRTLLISCSTDRIFPKGRKCNSIHGCICGFKKYSKYSSFLNEHLVDICHHANVLTVEDYSQMWVELQ